MPRNPKYENAKIYKVQNTITDDVYVGSTTQPLSKRLTQHRAQVKKGMKSKLSSLMEELGTDVFFIELIESYSCESIDELKAYENHHARQLKASLNKITKSNSKEISDTVSQSSSGTSYFFIGDDDDGEQAETENLESQTVETVETVETVKTVQIEEPLNNQIEAEVLEPETETVPHVLSKRQKKNLKKKMQQFNLKMI